MSDAPLAPTTVDDVTSERVLAIVRRHVPSFWRDEPILSELRLDDTGIGFDSVDLLELLLACERELGLELPVDLLLDDAMTVGDLIAKLQRVALAR